MRGIRLLLVLPLLLGAGNAAASRMIRMPPYPRRQYITFGGGTAATGTPIGVSIIQNISLSNLSNIAQTGTITLVPGTAGGGASNCPAGVYMTSRVFICADTTVVGPNYTSSPVVPTGGATFTLAPKAVANYVAGVFLTTVKGCSAGGMDYADTDFSPATEITINEDRGAILGSVTPDAGGSGYCAADYSPYQAGQGLIQLAGNFLSIPMAINGARPF